MHVCDFMLQHSLVGLSLFQALVKVALKWMYHAAWKLTNNKFFLECRLDALHHSEVVEVKSKSL